MMRRRAALLSAAALLVPRPAPAQTAEAPLRIGTLRYGSVNWVLDVARHHGLPETEGLRLEVVELASNAATQVALQARRVDLIVADWLWVARQRGEGADWSFAPFSAALGALVSPASAPIASPAELRGRRLGVAGSPLDKSWLLLRLLAIRRAGFDPADAAQAVFGAPPLLAEQLLAGRLDAVLTYWTSVARLEARGMRALLPVAEVLRELGFPEPLPMVGWTFSEAWAASRPDALRHLLRLTWRASGILAESEAEWRRLAPLTGAGSQEELRRLQAHFRTGLPQRWDAALRAEAARLYDALAAMGGERLVGAAAHLPPGTFHEGSWPPV
ncbi:MAG: ABC transporter substrate-binding protein [Acetobacteraceae bacterium]|nr:ABC transporter substrate-binding protein [Acetobacteraceae bacterium]